jgi:hypothetical protein
MVAGRRLIYQHRFQHAKTEFPTMMTERQRRFREQYVANISPWYNGLVHIGVMYVAAIAAIWWCVSQMQGATWEWLLIIPVAIAGNFGEWAMH